MGNLCGGSGGSPTSSPQDSTSNSPKEKNTNNEESKTPEPTENKNKTSNQNGGSNKNSGTDRENSKSDSNNTSEKVDEEKQEESEEPESPTSPNSVDTTDLNSINASKEQTEAVKKIQKAQREKQAREQAEEDNNWKIFNEIDAQDEAEMLTLAVFLQTLMDHVPGAQSGGVSSKDAIEAEFDEEEERRKSAVLSLDDIQIGEDGELAPKTFPLPKGPITSELADQIVEVLRGGGKLTTKAIQKLLRVNYRDYKSYPNTTHIHISGDEILHVVGDIHGQLADLLHIFDEKGLPSPTNKFLFNGDFVDRGL